MIKYKIKDNKIIAYFARNYNNDNNFWQWMDEIYANVSKQLGLKHHFETLINDKTYKYLFHKSNFYGIAKCHPNDVFDEQVGKQIARERLLAKFYIICDKVKQDVLDELLKVPELGRYKRLSEQYFKKIDTIFTDLTNYIAIEKFIRSLDKQKRG